MKTIKTVGCLAFILLLGVRPAWGMIELAMVSPARAKAMGIELKAEPRGPDQVWVSLKFKAEGELKQFDPRQP